MVSEWMDGTKPTRSTRTGSLDSYCRIDPGIDLARLRAIAQNSDVFFQSIGDHTQNRCCSLCEPSAVEGGIDLDPPENKALYDFKKTSKKMKNMRNRWLHTDLILGLRIHGDNSAEADNTLFGSGMIERTRKSEWGQFFAGVLQGGLAALDMFVEVGGLDEDMQRLYEKVARDRDLVAENVEHAQRRLVGRPKEVFYAKPAGDIRDGSLLVTIENCVIALGMTLIVGEEEDDNVYRSIERDGGERDL